MGVQVLPSVSQITDNNLPQLTVSGKVINIVIRNSNTSGQPLYVGINEDASSKISLDPGESLALNVAKDGAYYDGFELRFKYAATDPNNNGFCILEQETNKEVC
jgi:hypothetical protein